MKLITGITCFNGLEFLEACVKQFLKFSDHVIVCYQDVSHVGERRKVGDFVIPLFKDNPKVTINKFIPDDHYNFKRNEMKKHTQMVDVSREMGADYFILGAVDHFYDEKQVVNVIDKATSYDVSFTRTHQYYKHPIWQVEPQVDWHMPFTIKVYPNTRFEKVAKYPVTVDPACKINTTGTYTIFDDSELIVHNYSMIRQDINEKYKNRYIPMKWGTKKVAQLIKEYENYDIDANPGVEHYHGRKIKVVPNYFNL